MTEPAPPSVIDAASVIVLRDGEQGPETYVVVRHPKSRSFAGLLVFPGGKVDPEDALAAGDEVSDLDAGAAAVRLAPLAPPERALAQYVAAIRELFEEAGLLLAARGTEWASPALLGAPFSELRRALYEEGANLVDVCRRRELRLRASELEFFAHWITPELAPQRFDTRFFLTTLPPGQEALADERETSSGEWLRPAEALDRYAEGRAQLAPPTYMLLSELAGYTSVAAARDAARRRTAVTTILPKPFAREEGVGFLYPGDAGYAQGDPEQPGPRRRLLTVNGRWQVLDHD